MVAEENVVTQQNLFLCYPPTNPNTDWKKPLQIWTGFTSLEKKKQGPALVSPRDGKAQEAALKLTSD